MCKVDQADLNANLVGFIFPLFHDFHFSLFQLIPFIPVVLDLIESHYQQIRHSRESSRQITYLCINVLDALCLSKSARSSTLACIGQMSGCMKMLTDMFQLALGLDEKVFVDFSVFQKIF